MSFVKGGLQDLSISRTTLDWGIPVPDAPGHIIYVWVDALTNYITASGFPKVRSKAWKERWPASLHVIGKDITRFHAVYWPAFLMSAKIPLPDRVFSHGFLYNKGEKMSKSVGNVVAPLAMAETYGADPIRYFFLREVPFGQDGSFTHEAIVNRINADLANDLGNLAQRSLSMIAKNCGSTIPEPGTFTDADAPLLEAALGAAARLPRGDGPPGDPQGHRSHLACGCRRQPLFRGAGAVGAEENRPEAHGPKAYKATGGAEPFGFACEAPSALALPMHTKKYTRMIRILSCLMVLLAPFAARAAPEACKAAATGIEDALRGFDPQDAETRISIASAVQEHPAASLDFGTKLDAGELDGFPLSQEERGQFGNAVAMIYRAGESNGFVMLDAVHGTANCHSPLLFSTASAPRSR